MEGPGRSLVREGELSFRVRPLGHWCPGALSSLGIGHLTINERPFDVDVMRFVAELVR